MFFDDTRFGGTELRICAGISIAGGDGCYNTGVDTVCGRVGVAKCEDRIGTGPPLARTEVVYEDLGH